MAKFVYIDETGSVQAKIVNQPKLTLVAVVVDEGMVRHLAAHMARVAESHLLPVPDDFEFHGHELWSGSKHWVLLHPAELLAVYEDALRALSFHDIAIAHVTIDRVRLHAWYAGVADNNAYHLALQLLLEDVDDLGPANKVLVADESKEQELRAISMVADMKQWGIGLVRGKQLRTVIDSLHFVRSHNSPGVQFADLVAFLLQRRHRSEPHPDAEAAKRRMCDLIDRHTRAHRQWPS